MKDDPGNPASTDQAERPRLIISREEERLIQRAWPFETKNSKNLITDIHTLRQEVLQYFGLHETEQNLAASSLEECLQDLRNKYNIIDLPLEPETHSLLGDSGLLIVTHTDGVEVIRPSQWRRKKRKNVADGQIIMLFHGLPKTSASVMVLLQRVLHGRCIQLLTIVVVALIAVLISLGPTWLQAYIFNDIIPNGQRYLMIQIAAFLLCIKLTSSGLKLFNQLVGLRLELYLGLNTTALLVHRLLSLPLSFYGQYNIGDLQLRVNSAHVLRRALQQSFVSVITAVFVVVLNIGLVFFKTYSLELCLILLVATAFGPTIDAVTAMIESFIRLKRLNLSGKLQNDILHPLESIGTIRALGLEEEVSIRFAGTRHRIARLDIQLGLIKTSLQIITLCLNAAVISILLYLFSSPQTLSWIGADSNGAMPTQGLVVVLLSAFSTINGGIRSLSTSILTLVKVIPDTIRFTPILKKEIDTAESNHDETIALSNLTLIRPSMKTATLTVLRGETVAILHNNAQIAAIVLKTLAGHLDHPDLTYADWRVIINNDIKQSDAVDLVLRGNSVFISSSPVFTAGSIEEFITDYDVAPDEERVRQCIKATAIDMTTLDTNKKLVSGMGVDSHLNQTEALTIQMARSLYSKHVIILLDRLTDEMGHLAISGLKEYCNGAKKMLFISTASEELACSCDKIYDVRENVQTM